MSSLPEHQEHTRTNEIRQDPVLGRLVVLSPARSRRPSEFKSQSKNPNEPNSRNTSSGVNRVPRCPFCRGREHECAPEIFRRSDAGEWRLRVIENLYPALRRDVDPPKPESGTGAAELAGGRMVGFGFHDVVIETPWHEEQLWDLDAELVAEVLLAYKERILQLEKLGTVKYAQVFKNYGSSAGASMAHSHSQIMGIPVVPSSVTSRLSCMRESFEKTGKCILCEVPAAEFLIQKTAHFIAVAPFAASYAFEIWIIPREHRSYFHDIDPQKAVDLGALLKTLLQKLCKQLDSPPFNFMIHSAPFGLSPSSTPYAHWFLQIVPHLGVIGGFEIGTGCFINSVFPEDAAEVLRVNCEE